MTKTCLKLNAEIKDRWDDFRDSGLHLSAEEVDAWLARLEAAGDAAIPDCHS